MSLGNEKNELFFELELFGKGSFLCAEAISAPCSSDVLLPKKEGGKF
jgi:hypothetical protein